MCTFALEKAISLKLGPDAILKSQTIFAVMVFSILIAAPFCASWIQFFGPRWLSKEPLKETKPTEAKSNQEVIIKIAAEVETK